MSRDPKPGQVKTVHAVSAGGVAFRSDGGCVEIALIKTSEEGKWQLPKGLIDPGETAEIAALREVSEEAGIVCELIEPIDSIEYWFFASFDGERKRYHKRVHFFLMRYLSGDVSDHDHEVIEAGWSPINEAVKLLEFPNEKAIADKASSMIEALQKQARP